VSGYDAIVVGAGFSGAIMAERMAKSLGFQVLLLEQRPHLAGNCYDEQDADGTLVHVYGPHLFHTSHEDVWRYLSAFTDWQPYQHHVQAQIDGALIPLPFNLNSIDAVFDPELARMLRENLRSRYGEGAKVPILDLMKVEDADLKTLAQFVYDKVFANYTAKQWGVPPEQIAPEVTARVPVVISRDNRYFHDPHQAQPKAGFTAMFAKILDHPKITVALGQACKTRLRFDTETCELFLDDMVFNGPVVYTGLLDELFDYRHGALAYRSLRFDFEYLANTTYQSGATINFPHDHDFTRITEFKHIANSDAAGTTIVREYPQAYDRTVAGRKVPYYPVLNDQNRTCHQHYQNLAQRFPNLICLGRLADYRYYNMDEAAKRALETFERLAHRETANNSDR
jgi:UDP-galactopyranose mutase